MSLTKWQTTIPTKFISGLKMIYLGEENNISFPLSTYETPLFASVARGVRVSKQHPILANVVSSCMTRSVIFECKTSYECIKLSHLLDVEKQSCRYYWARTLQALFCKLEIWTSLGKRGFGKDI